MKKLTLSKCVNFVLRITFTSILVSATSTSVQAETLTPTSTTISHGGQKFELSNSSLDIAADDRPFGVNLTKITLVNQRDAHKDTAFNADGVDLSRAGILLQTPNIISLLKPFIGKPLSVKLVSQLRAEITFYFRQIDRPLVDVIIPPQEISGGALRIDYIPFVIGERRVEGNEWTEDKHILDALHFEVGEEIDSEILIDDLNWLNLNPYRNLVAVFEPGQKAGTTNIILRSQEAKPWTVWAGYNNAGSRNSDPHRIYAGFDVANLPFIDHQFNYQLTTSPTTLGNGGIFGLSKKDGYFSHYANYYAPIVYGNGWRHKLNLQASYTQGRTSNAPFTKDNKTQQVYGEYAMPLPLFSTIRSEAYGAVDYKHLTNLTEFGGLQISAKTLDIAQFVVGLRGSFSTPFGFSQSGQTCDRCNLGRGNFDIRLVASPGGFGTNNKDAAFINMANNVAATARYNYIYGKIDHVMPLPARFKWKSAFAFQLSNDFLPAGEQLAMGGTRSVRGYLSGEVAGENGFTLSNELSLPPISLLGKALNANDSLTAYGFVDMGMSFDKTTGKRTDLLGVGGGLDYRFNSNFTASMAISRALKTGPITNIGDTQIAGGFKISF